MTSTLSTLLKELTDDFTSSISAFLIDGFKSFLYLFPTITAPENNPTPLPAADTKFEVKQGDFFSTAADKLLQAGLIKDKQEFIKTVQGMGLENKLQIGIFTIPAGSTDTDIAKILTKTN